jgi:hypothetical protein
MPDPAAEGATEEASYPAFQRTADELEARIPFLISELSLKKERSTSNGSQ